MNYIKIRDLSKPNKGFYGLSASSCEYKDTFPQYLRITDIDDYGNAPKKLSTCINPTMYPDWERYVLRNNDIVFARTGNSTGRNYLCKNIRNNTVFAGFLIRFSINPDLINPSYLGYYCQSISYWNQVSSMFTGSTRNNINAEQYGDLIIPVPDSHYQQHIVNTIGSIDDLIDILQRKYNQLIKNNLLIFDKFETDNKLLFSDVFETYNGGTFKNVHYVKYSPYKLITIKNVDESGFNTTSTSYLPEDKIDEKYLLSIGDIVLTMTGNIGRCGIVDEKNCYLNQRVLKLKCKSKLYLFCYLTKYKQEIIQLGRGTAQLNLSLEDLKNLVVNNSISEINTFCKFDILFEKMVNIKLQIKKLKEIKKQLLNKYFTNL